MHRPPILKRGETGGVPAQQAHMVIELTSCEQQIIEADVISWQPLDVTLRVWNPRLTWLAMLIGNKLARHDRVAFEANVSDYLAVIDLLVTGALLDLADGISRRQKLINQALAALLFVNTAVYLASPTLCATLAVVGIVSLFIAYRTLEVRKERLYQLLERHAGAINERRSYLVSEATKQLPNLLDISYA